MIKERDLNLFASLGLIILFSQFWVPGLADYPILLTFCYCHMVSSGNYQIVKSNSEVLVIFFIVSVQFSFWLIFLGFTQFIHTLHVMRNEFFYIFFVALDSHGARSALYLRDTEEKKNGQGQKGKRTVLYRVKVPFPLVIYNKIIY